MQDVTAHFGAVVGGAPAALQAEDELVAAPTAAMAAVQLTDSWWTSEVPAPALSTLALLLFGGMVLEGNVHSDCALLRPL